MSKALTIAYIAAELRVHDKHGGLVAHEFDRDLYGLAILHVIKKMFQELSKSKGRRLDFVIGYQMMMMRLCVKIKLILKNNSRVSKKIFMLFCNCCVYARKLIINSTGNFRFLSICEAFIYI